MKGAVGLELLTEGQLPADAGCSPSRKVVENGGCSTAVDASKALLSSSLEMMLRAYLSMSHSLDS